MRETLIKKFIHIFLFTTLAGFSCFFAWANAYAGEQLGLQKTEKLQIRSLPMDRHSISPSVGSEISIESRIQAYLKEAKAIEDSISIDYSADPDGDVSQSAEQLINPEFSIELKTL